MIIRSLSAAASQVLVTLPVSEGSFLYPGAVITVTITNVTVSSPAAVAGMDADISATDGSVQITVADAVANIVVGFTEQSLISNINEGQ